MIGTNDNKYGFINEKGETVVKPSYDSISSYFSEDGIAIMIQFTGGFEDRTTTFVAVDTSGKVLFSAKGYTSCSQFVNGYLIVVDDNKDAFVLDKTGKRIFSIGKYSSFEIHHLFGVYDNMIIFQQEDSFGLKDLNGEIAIRAKYDMLIPYNAIQYKKDKHQDLYLAEKDDKWGVINNKDEVIISFREGEVIPINSDKLLAGKSRNLSIIDLNGKDVCRENFEEIAFALRVTGSTFATSDVSGDASRAIEVEKTGIDYDTIAVDTEAVVEAVAIDDTTWVDSNYSGY